MVASFKLNLSYFEPPLSYLKATTQQVRHNVTNYAAEIPYLAAATCMARTLRLYDSKSTFSSSSFCGNIISMVYMYVALPLISPLFLEHAPKESPTV